MNYLVDPYNLAAVAITYLLHSSVWILLVAAILKGKPFRSPFLENTLWKVALVGGLLTTTIALLQADHSVELNKPSATAILPPSPESKVISAEAGIATPRQPLILTEEASMDLPTETFTESSPQELALPVVAKPQYDLTHWLPWVWGGAILWIFFFRIGQHLWFVRKIGKRTIINNPTVLHIMASIQRRTPGPIHFWISSSPFLDSPIVIQGKEICLPSLALAEMKESQLEAMIAHEWAHIVRRDHRWALFISLLNTLFFFQPLHRLAKQGIHRSNELLCDAQAARMTGNALALAESLVAVASWIKPKTTRSVLVAGMASQQSELSARITQLLNIPDMKIERFKKLKLSLPSFLLLAFALVVLPGFRFVSPASFEQSPETQLLTTLAAELSQRAQEAGVLATAITPVPANEVEPAAVVDTDIYSTEEVTSAASVLAARPATDALSGKSFAEVQSLAYTPLKSDHFQALPLQFDRSKASCADLLRAVKSGQVERVKELLKSVDPDCAFFDEGEPRSSLVAAARQGNLEITDLLLKAKADVEYKARGDESPLMAAANYGHLALVKLLVANGAKVNRKISGDGTALIGAVRGGHYEVAKYLLEQGANPFAVVSGDEYAMYHARINEDKKMIKLLRHFEDKE